MTARCASVQQSLTRLRTDHLDLLQIHGVSMKDDPFRLGQAGCVVAALQEAARAEGDPLHRRNRP